MRWRSVLAVTAVVLAVVGALVVVAGSRIASTLEQVTGLGPECRVAGSVAGEERFVDLSRDQAEALTTRAAGVVRRGWGPDRARRALNHAAVAADLRLDDTQVRLLADALTGRAPAGRTPAALTCGPTAAAEHERDTLDRRGLTARAARVRTDLLDRFGPQQLGGFAPGGVSSGHGTRSAHYDGRAVDVFYRPITRAGKERGWVTAQYLVAHAERLDVETIIFDARIWTRWRAAEGWRTYDVDTSGVPRPTARILLHRDHVHVDVAD